MVGAPKRLQQLSKMDANLAVRCRGCGHRRVYDRVLLSRELIERGANMTWEALPYALPCRCGSTSLSLTPICGALVDPEMRQYQRRLVRLAADVLVGAGRRAGVAELATVELRLALHVLRPWVPAEHLATFWREAVDNHSRFKSLGVPEAAAIVVRELKMRGRLDP